LANLNSKKNLTQRVLDGLLWTTSSYGVQAVLRLVVITVLARLLTPEDFGLMSAASIVLGLAAYITEFGLFSVIEQRAEIEERHLRTALTLYTVLGTLLGLAIFLGAGFIANLFQMEPLVPIIRVVSLAFPLVAFEALPRALLKRQLRFRWLAAVTISSYALGVGGVGIVMAWLGFGVWALIAGGLAQGLISKVILYLVQPYPKRPQIELQALRELTFLGGGYAIGRIFIYLGEQVDNLVVGRWLGAGALGIYGRAYQLLVFPVTLFGSALKVVLLPSMAKLQHDPARLGMAYRRAMALIALVFLPMTAVAVVLAPEIVLTLLGPRWTGVILPFQVLAAGIFFRSNYKISDSMVQATGEVYRRAGRSAAFGVLTLAGALAGLPWGVTGVAAGVLVALGLNSIMLAQLCLKLVSLSWQEFVKAHLPGALLGAMAFAVAWPVAMQLRALALPAFAVLAGSLVAAGLILLLLVYRMPKFLLGEDGHFMLQTMTSFVAAKVRVQGQMPRVKGEHLS
jgi:PST family polysaccharide transporter